MALPPDPSTDPNYCRLQEELNGVLHIEVNLVTSIFAEAGGTETQKDDDVSAPAPEPTFTARQAEQGELTTRTTLLVVLGCALAGVVIFNWRRRR